jgi:Rieske Fe-S protein
MSSLHDDQGRRRFFARVIAFIHAAVGGTMAVMLGGAAVSPAFARRQENWWAAGDLKDLPANEPTPVVIRVARQDGYSEAIDRRTVFLVRNDDTQITALDATCTHLGCRVSWDSESGQLKCPCHGGVYDRNGAVVAGPPPAPLATLATRLEGDQVLVQL